MTTPESSTLEYGSQNSKLKIATIVAGILPILFGIVAWFQWGLWSFLYIASSTIAAFCMAMYGERLVQKFTGWPYTAAIAVTSAGILSFTVGIAASGHISSFLQDTPLGSSFVGAIVAIVAILLTTYSLIYSASRRNVQDFIISLIAFALLATVMSGFTGVYTSVNKEADPQQVELICSRSSELYPAECA